MQTASRGKPLGRRERRPRIADDDVKADELRRLTELRRGVNGADHVENRRREERLDEYVDDADRSPLGGSPRERRSSFARESLIERSVAARADRRLALVFENDDLHSAADAPLGRNDSDERHRPPCPARIRQHTQKSSVGI
jgi:hypothetical protein